jgi:hypothetical protein
MDVYLGDVDSAKFTTSSINNQSISGSYNLMFDEIVKTGSPLGGGFYGPPLFSKPAEQTVEDKKVHELILETCDGFRRVVEHIGHIPAEYRWRSYKPLNSYTISNVLGPSAMITETYRTFQCWGEDENGFLVYKEIN